MVTRWGTNGVIMDIHIKWAVMAQLRRSNPALPPRAKAGCAQRRLDTAIEVASDAFYAEFRDWAARIILAPPGGERDPLYAYLANRLADIIWSGESPNWRHVEAWWHLYTKQITEPPYRRGFKPRGWEIVAPDTYHRNQFPIGYLSSFKRELLKCAGEIDGSFQVSTWWKENKELFELVRTPYFTCRAIQLINRVTKNWHLPLPTYRGREYVGGKSLPYYALLRYFLLRNREDWACRVAHYIGRTFVHRHVPSGRIYGPWVEGRAVPGKRELNVLSFHIDPRITQGADFDLVFKAESALGEAIR